MTIEAADPATGGQDQTWRVGDLAEAAGLSVRALHHYDQVGLLRPSRRSSAGHRLYVADDVRRLHRIVTLRGFGLSLAQIAQVLDGDLADPRALIRCQLRQVEAQIAAGERLRRRLIGVLDGLATTDEPSPYTLMELMEVASEMSRQLTSEEFDELRRKQQRWAEGLTRDEFATFAARRREAIAGLSEAQLHEMRQRKAALLPDAQR